MSDLTDEQKAQKVKENLDRIVKEGRLDVFECMVLALVGMIPEHQRSSFDLVFSEVFNKYCAPKGELSDKDLFMLDRIGALHQAFKNKPN